MYYYILLYIIMYINIYYYILIYINIYYYVYTYYIYSIYIYCYIYVYLYTRTWLYIETLMRNCECFFLCSFSPVYFSDVLAEQDLQKEKQLLVRELRKRARDESDQLPTAAAETQQPSSSAAASSGAAEKHFSSAAAAAKADSAAAAVQKKKPRWGPPAKEALDLGTPLLSSSGGAEGAEAELAGLVTPLVTSRPAAWAEGGRAAAAGGAHPLPSAAAGDRKRFGVSNVETVRF